MTINIFKVRQIISRKINEKFATKTGKGLEIQRQKHFI